MIEYGCECGGCHVHPDPKEQAAAPVAYIVQRDCRPLRVCTACRRSCDKVLLALVEPGDPGAVFFRYDPLGFFALLAYMGHEEEGVVN